MLAVILDTETTGITAPEVIELACMGPLHSPCDGDEVQHWTFKPSKPIELGAMATHHILDEDLVAFPPWPGTWRLSSEVEYICGHNIDYDWEAIGRPDVKRICTLALARIVWPELDSHSLGALTYHLHDHGEARRLLKHAHSAATDVELCGRVLLRLIDATGAKTWPELWTASELARIPLRMTFGKYGPGEPWSKDYGGGQAMLCAEVRWRDPNYYGWLFDKCDRVRNDPYLQKALRGETVTP